MNSAVRMLLAERWRRTRWFIAAMYAFFACAVVAVYAYPTDVMVELFVGAAAMSLGGIGVGIPFSYYEDGKVPLGFLERFYRLPVRTWVLVSVHIGYALAAIGLLYVLFVVSCFTLLPTNRIVGYGSAGGSVYDVLDVLPDVAVIGGSIVVGFAVFQMWCWIVCRANTYIGLPLVLIGTYLTAVCALLVGWELGARDLGAAVLLAGLAVLTFLVSLAFVQFDRRGGWSDVRAWMSFDWFKWSGRTKPFVSAEEALRWYEWRRTAYILPVMAVVGAIGMMLVPIHGTPTYDLLTGDRTVLSDNYVQNALFVLFFLPLVAAWCAGLLSFGFRHTDWQSGLIQFHLTRPVNTQVLAAARLRTGLRSVLLTFGFLLVLLGVVVVIDHVWEAHLIDLFVWLAEDRVTLGMAAGVIVMGLGCGLALWTVYWLSPALTVVFGLFLLAMTASISVLIVTRGEIGGHIDPSYLWDNVTPVLALPVLVAMAFALVTAWRRKLLGGGMFVTALCGMFLIDRVLLYSAGLFPAGHPGALVLNTALLAVLPWIPLASVPLILHYQRHR